jgi:hypothetical protein
LTPHEQTSNPEVPLRMPAKTNPEFCAVIASFLRRTLVTGDFGATGLHAVSLREEEEDTAVEALIACLQSLDREMRREHPLLEFEADYFVYGDAAGETLLARTCAVIRRHRHTLRRLNVPGLAQNRASSAFADALAECTAITSLDLSWTTLPFRSWQQLGPTLHTLTLVHTSATDGGRGIDTTFRLLADNMPVLRKLEFHVEVEPSQDGFMEVVSRLRSLSFDVEPDWRTWDSVGDTGAWPQTLPRLEELTWMASAKVDPFAVAVLRRAVSLRAAVVSHASALAAIAAGPVAGVDSGAAVTPPLSLSPCMYAPPLSNVQTLTLTGIGYDSEAAANLVTTPAASLGVSALRLWWFHGAAKLRIMLRALASTASHETGVGWFRVRRMRIHVNHREDVPDPEAAARDIRALFPRARHASCKRVFLMET